MVLASVAKKRKSGMHQYTNDVRKLLDDLGLSLPRPGCPELLDYTQAETCYVHHSSVPTATVGYALVSSTFARGKFPKLTFIDMMDKRASMDEREVCALADLCGADVTPPFWGNPRPFTEQLFRIIEKYDLWALFARDDRAEKGTPFEIRPLGSNEEEASAEVLKKWRAEFKKLPEVRKMMVLSILGLYNANALKNHWLYRVPKPWHAAYGIDVLREANALADWAKLYATYSGW